MFFTDVDFGIALDSDIPRLLSLGEDRVLVCVKLVNSHHLFSNSRLRLSYENLVFPQGTIPS